MNKSTTALLAFILLTLIVIAFKLPGKSGGGFLGDVNDLGTGDYTISTTSVLASFDATSSDSTGNVILQANPARQDVYISCASGTAYIYLTDGTSTEFASEIESGATSSSIIVGPESDTLPYFHIGGDNLYKGMVRGIASTSHDGAWCTIQEK